MAALNNVTTANGYTDANTLNAPASTTVNLRVRNAAIYYQFGHGWPAPMWDDEVFCLPGDASLDRNVDHVRVRSAIIGTPAQVTVEAVT